MGWICVCASFLNSLFASDLGERFGMRPHVRPLFYAPFWFTIWGVIWGVPSCTPSSRAPSFSGVKFGRWDERVSGMVEGEGVYIWHALFLCPLLNEHHCDTRCSVMLKGRDIIAPISDITRICSNEHRFNAGCSPTVTRCDFILKMCDRARF